MHLRYRSAAIRAATFCVAVGACAPAGRAPAAPTAAVPSAASSGAASSGAASPGAAGPGAASPWPEPPPPAIAAAVGLYAAGADTVVLLEDGGRLHVIAADSARRPLRPAGAPGRYAVAGVAGDTVALAGPAAGGAAVLRRGGRDYLRLHVAPDDGASFRIVPERPVEELRAEALAAAPPAQPDSLRAPELVELTTLDASIRLDVRYATTNNFMGARFYDEARAFLQRPAAAALVRVSRRLRPLGLGLLVHDAYRPWYVTRMFWDATPERQREFVADPATGSRHNRGGAVDLSLYDLATGTPIEMPSGYDEFSPRARWDWPGGTARQRALRDLLRRAMSSEGFQVYAPEWWHFDHESWRAYPVLDLPFSALGAGARP